jgi:exosortase D (VPLPA-CTERM-specific)
MNSIRIGIIGIVVNYTGLEHVEGLTHLLEGWVIFITCVLLLFGIAKLMLLLQPARLSLAESLDLSIDGLALQFARFRHVQPSAALMVSLALVAAGTVGWQMLPRSGEPVIRREPLALVSPVLGDWRLAATQYLEPRIERELRADDYIVAHFERAATEPSVELFVAWYDDQTRGGIHSPEVCLPGGGWEMAEIRRVDVGHAVGTPGALPINRAIIQKGEEKLLVYYWFEQYGGRTASDFTAKMALLKYAVYYGRTDGALVRMLTPIRPGEDVALAEERLQALLKPVMAELPRFVPRR